MGTNPLPGILIHLTGGHARFDEGCHFIQNLAGNQTRRPHQLQIFRGLELYSSHKISETPTYAALFQETIVMAHHQVGFNLAHGVQQNADGNQYAGTTKKLRDILINVQLP